MNSSVIDPWTKEYFIPKRTNQRFELRENQINYNNRLAYLERHAKRDIDLILKKNRRIIRNLLGANKDVVVKREVLLNKGYKFNFLTHTILVNREQDKQDKYINCIYEFAVEKMNDEQYKIYLHGRQF